MRIIIIAGALLCTVTLSAQNWSLLNSKDSYNYTVNGDTLNSIIYTVETDSVTVENGDSVFYLNSRIRPCNICDADDIYVLGPVFELFGTKVIQKTDIFLFVHQDTNIIIPTAKIHDTWVFNASKNQEAEVTDIVTMTLFGQEDSVKVISVSDSDIQEVLISKNYGIVGFYEPGDELYEYDYNYLIMNDDNEENQQLVLIGLSGSKTGKYPPKFHEYFEALSMDDILVYEYNDWYNWDESGYYTKKEVTGLISSTDSFTVNFNTYVRAYTYIKDPVCWDCPGEKRLNPNISQNEITETYPTGINNDYNANTGELIDFYTERIRWINYFEAYETEDFKISVSNRIHDGKYEKIYSGGDIYHIPFMVKSDTNSFYYIPIQIAGQFGPDLYYEIYREGLSLISSEFLEFEFSSSYNLIGYNINGTEDGTISSVNEKELNFSDKTNKYFQIQTDNISKTLKIHSSSGNPFPDNMELQISDISGRLVYSGELIPSETLLDVSDFSPGIYILRIAGNNFSESHKFIVGF